MGAKTKIDWCDSTWNPVTGCLHGCEYCYARTIAKRFKPKKFPDDFELIVPVGYPDPIYVLDKPYETFVCYEKDIHGFVTVRTKKEPYPYGFEPTIHRYLLDKPQHWKKPRNIFVCSMADLFGEWVPDEWILDVFEACEKAPQHRYLFLTKNPARYIKLSEKGILPKDSDNMWFGSTVTKPDEVFISSSDCHTFLSMEPILEPFSSSTGAGLRICEMTDWIIIGAETGNRKDKIIPKARWIIELVQNAEKAGTPVFMKESLRGIMGDCFRQEFPW